MPVRWASISSAQLNGDFIIGIVFSLGSLVMVHTFSLSFVTSFLTSCTPSLAVGFALQPSNNMVGLGDKGQWSTVSKQGSWVLLAELLGTVCTSFVPRFHVSSTLFTLLLASVWVLVNGTKFICDIVVVVVGLGGPVFVVVECE